MMSKQDSLNIVHCFRSPVGGIFRHVRDLAEQHHKAGHRVGILCDSSTGGPHEDALIESIMPFLDLGLIRTPIKRSIAPSDIVAFSKSANKIKSLQPNIIHGHGAKGGALARLIGSRLRVARSRVARFYSPHGGSLHYSSAQLSGRLYFMLERWLAGLTDGIAFVSDFERRTYQEKVGASKVRSRLIYNGLAEHEFEDVAADKDAADFMYVGEMRDLKGPDVFIDAHARAEDVLKRTISAVMIGDGPDKASYAQMLRDSGRDERIHMHPAMPIAKALRLGRIIIVPSRAESLPYLVLEALAAGKPVIASDVGGIPEIFGNGSGALVPPGDAEALGQAMAAAIREPETLLHQQPAKSDLRTRFSAGTMADAMMDFYRECLN